MLLCCGEVYRLLDFLAVPFNRSLNLGEANVSLLGGLQDHPTCPVEGRLPDATKGTERFLNPAVLVSLLKKIGVSDCMTLVRVLLELFLMDMCPFDFVIQFRGVFTDLWIRFFSRHGSPPMCLHQADGSY